MPRHARRDPLDERAAHLHLVEGPHDLAVMAHARKYDLRRGPEPRRIPHQRVLGADFGQRVLH